MPSNNGHANGKLIDPAAVREHTKQLRIANRHAKAELEAKLIATQKQLLESWGNDYGDPFGFGGSDEQLRKIRSQYGEGYWIPLSTPSDRAGGAKWPVWRQEQELSRLRQGSRVLVATNDYAKCLLKNLTNAIIGKGYTYKAVPDKVRAKRLGLGKETLDKFAESVQIVIDNFLELNRWNSGIGNLEIDFGLEADMYSDTGSASTREREIYRRVCRDGEAFVRFFYMDDGQTIVRPVDPELITQPPGGTWQNGWSHGIRWQVNPVVDLEKRMEFFHRHHDPSVHSKETEGWRRIGYKIPAWEMVQIMSEEEDAEIMRGTPLFSFATLRALLRAESLQETLSITAKVRAATAEIWQHHYGTLSEIQNMATGLASRVVYNDNPGDFGSNPAQVIERVVPGAKRRIPQGQEMKEPPGGTGIPEFIQAAQGDLRMASAGFAAPEYMTGDASNSNYSSAVEAGTPWVRSAEAEQEHYKIQFLKCIRRAVHWAAKCNKIPRAALRVIEIQIECPQVHKNNEGEIANKYSQMLQAKVISPQTWQMKEGLDSEQEIENWKEWDQEMGQQQGDMPGMPGAPGGSPGGAPGGPPGADGDAPSGAEGAMPPGQEALSGAGAEAGAPGQEAVGGEQPPGAEAQQPGQQPGAEQPNPEEDELGGVNERADAMADVLGGTYGEAALQMLDQAPNEEAQNMAEALDILNEKGANSQTRQRVMAAMAEMMAADLIEDVKGKTGGYPRPSGYFASKKGAAIPTNFTGVITDSLGRKQHYVSGVHVSGNQNAEQLASRTGKQVRGEHGDKTLSRYQLGSMVRLHDAKQQVSAALQGDKHPKKFYAMLDNLSRMTVKQLHELKKEYGLKCSAQLKMQLVQKLGDRLNRSRRNTMLASNLPVDQRTDQAQAGAMQPQDTQKFAVNGEQATAQPAEQPQQGKYVGPPGENVDKQGNYVGSPKKGKVATHPGEGKEQLPSNLPAAEKDEQSTQADPAAKIKGLLDNIGQNLTYSQIDKVVDSLKGLSEPDIVNAAAKNGMTLAGRGKGQRLQELRRRIRDRQGSYERIQFRPDTPVEPKAAAQSKVAAAKYLKEGHTPPPPGKAYSPNVEKVNPKTGCTEASRVGVPGMNVPPPPELPKLPRLTPDERNVESGFNKQYESDPDGWSKKFLQMVQSTAKPGEPLVFGTDDAKALNDCWTADDEKVRLQNRATLNAPLHQAANAICKRAFMQHLDTLKKGDQILVTVGGCGSGKGFSIKNNDEAKALKGKCAAVWDSAGDQNATENPWIQAEAEKRGLKVNYMFVHADAKTAWAHPEFGVVKRAADPKDGRMVGARVFADSYAIGAKNMQAFYEKHKDNQSASFMFLSAGKRIDGIPKEALGVDRKELYNFAVDTINKSDAPGRIKRGALVDQRIWRE